MTNGPGTQFSDGEGYERLMGRWSRMVGVPFLAWLNMSSGLSWLDVGCGNGAFTEEIIRHAAPSKVCGVDPSPQQLQHVKGRPQAALARFQQGDAQALPFLDQEFDVAVMALAISFVPNPSEAVKELKRVTRKGGVVATYMWDVPGGGVPVSPVVRVLKKMGLPVAMPPHPEVSEIEALCSLCEEAGMTGIETRVFYIPVTFPDFETLWADTTLPIGPLGEQLQNLDDRTRAALRQQLQASLPTAPDGSITYEAFANAVKGRA
jgi:SAM-dependent methyltransferase